MSSGARKTVSLPAPTYQRALRLARRQHLSVPAYLETLIEEKASATGDSSAAELLKESFAMAERAAKKSPGRLIVDKDELHD